MVMLFLPPEMAYRWLVRPRRARRSPAPRSCWVPLQQMGCSAVPPWMPPQGPILAR